MASRRGGGETDGSLAPSAKGPRKRRAPRTRACDQCRRRKVRCDAAEVDGPRCSSCIAFDFECTYLAGTDKRFCDVDYVKNLEKELEEMRKLCLKQQSILRAHGISTNDSIEAGSPSTQPSTPMLPPLTSPLELGPAPVDDGPDVTKGLIESFEGMEIHRDEFNHIGPSSNLSLIRTAIDLRQDYVTNSQSKEDGPPIKANSLRPEFWEIRKVQLTPPEKPYTDFPDPALLDTLVAKYFEMRHPMAPLLHRPTFEAGIRDGLHLRDEGFGATVLLVCALGAKLSERPAGVPSGERGWHWAGWRWFEQVRDRRRLVPLKAPSLYDLQVIYLIVAYVGGSIMPHTNCALITHALRLAQDMGLHRRTTYPAKPNVESELKKRAFWCLLGLERGMCMVLGRPCSLSDDDYDVDYPVECDDEYWINDDPELAFKQPEGKPAVMSFAMAQWRHGRIIGAIFQNLYSLRASRSLSDPERAQLIVSELDSELNKLIDLVPPHLKWDNGPTDPMFAGQAVALHASGHLLRIMIHRPFIPLPHKPTVLPFPSFTICTNAARAAVQALDKYRRRFDSERVLPSVQLVLLTSALILLLNIWGGKRAGMAVDTARDMEEVNKVLDMFKELEIRYNAAGRLWDILNNLKSVVDEPSQHQLHSQKRRREEDISAANSSYSESGDDTSLPHKRFQQRSTPPREASTTDHLLGTPEGTTLPSTDFDFRAFWQTLEMQSDTTRQGAFAAPSASAADTNGMVVEPDFEALFAGLIPAPEAYTDPFASASQVPGAYPDPFAPSNFAAGSSGTFAEHAASSAHGQHAGDAFVGASSTWDVGPSDLSWGIEDFDDPAGDGFASGPHWPGQPQN